MDVTLDGYDDSSASQVLNRASIAGAVVGAEWSLAGPVGGVSMAGALGTLSTSQWTDGTVQSATVGSLKVTGGTGNLGADLTLTQSCAAGQTALRCMTVAGTVSGEVRAAGNIGKVTVGGMGGACFLAGVAATSDLPDETGDFTAQASIKCLRLTGSGQSNFAGSSVAAWQLGTVLGVRDDTDDSGTAFGFAADYIRRLTVQTDQGDQGGTGLDEPDQDSLSAGDLVVRLL